MFNWLSRFGRPTNNSHRAARKNRHAQTESLESRTLLTNVLITVENLSPDGGLLQTPFWVGFHDGSFDIGDAGEAAGGGLEEIAEGGDTSVLSERFADESDGVDATIVAPEGFEGAPVFDVGETVSFEIDVDNPEENQYFSFATMVIPSNDAFLANLNSEAYRVFRNSGQMVRPFSIELYGDDVYDAGTEVNNPFGGAAFSTEGGDSVDENGVIHRPEMGLDGFIGTGTPVGDIESTFIAQTPLARITISAADDPSEPVDTTGPRTSLGEVQLLDDDTAAIEVVYSDPSGVDLDTIGRKDVLIRARGTFGRAKRRANDFDVESLDENNRTVVATYFFDVPEGLNEEDSGTVRVRVKRNRVSDELGNGVRGTRVGSFVAGPSTQLAITIENLADDDGLYLTPFFVGLHNGRFDIGTRGARASEALEALAEEGDTAGLHEQFEEDASHGSSATILAPGGFAGAPVFDPGESVTQIIDVDSPAVNRFFSFASMVIPSNDTFVANLYRKAHGIFTRRGEFRGPVEIMVYGKDVFDAGTEVNDPEGGAAFSTEGGESTAEGRRIRRSRGIDNFIGTGIPTGAELDAAFSRRTAIAKITIDLAGDDS
ncbi:MAG: spondin domain-containing protein [Planctomycetaceae bacterium]